MISAYGLTVYTEMPLTSTLAHLNAGQPIDCWYYDASGQRHSATYVFTEYEYVRAARPGETP